MNKKVIAMAIAATMAAPMAAQAEDGLAVSGRAALEFTGGDLGLSKNDSGQGRLNMAYTMGAITINYNHDMRAFGNNGFREANIAYKMGDATISYGRIGGAVKNIEADPFIATFLQMRGNATTGGAFGSSSFVNDTLAYRGKVGGMKLNADFGSGYMGLAAVGENWFVGYNDQGTTKAGMSFGAIKVIYDDPTGISVDYSMEAAGGKMSIAAADNGWYRVAWKGKAMGQNIHAGLANPGTNMTYGVGIIIKY